MELSLEAWEFSDKFTIENNSVYVQVVQHDIPIVKLLSWMFLIQDIQNIIGTKI